MLMTSARVTSFDVAGDADHCQCVDAAQTEHQREETVHLWETNRTGNRCVPVQAPPSSNHQVQRDTRGSPLRDTWLRYKPSPLFHWSRILLKPVKIRLLFAL